MAKKKSPKTIHTHVPSHIGFGIIAVVALVIGLAVVTQYTTDNQVQSLLSHAAAPVVKPVAPVTTANTTKKCISYNTSGKCVLYQTTTTVVNTRKPCISYNTSGQCTYYQGTTQSTKTFVPTQQPVKKTCTTIKKCTAVGRTGGCLVANYIQVCR
jgi:hypothetical protein